MEFNVYLRRLRIENELTLSQLAMDSGVSQGYLSQIESRKRGVPSPDVLKKLCDPLNVSHVEIMQAAGYIENVGENELYKHEQYNPDCYEIKNLTEAEKEYLETQLEIFRKFREGRSQGK